MRNPDSVIGNILSSATTRQAYQMTVLRLGGIAVGVVAQIYAARVLGPEKLGISGMALTVAAQGGLLVSFGADTLLVRQYRESSDLTVKENLIRTAFTLRFLLTCLLGLAMLAALPLLATHPQFVLASACVLPMIYFQNNQALWVLQADEKVPAQYLANTAGAGLSAALIFLFIRNDSPAGIDAVIGLASCVLAFWISWRAAHASFPKFKFIWPEMRGLLLGAKWLFLSSLVTFAYTRLEQPMIGLLRSVEELGIYRSALQIISGVQPILAMIPLLLYPKLITWRGVSLDHLWRKQWQLFWVFFPLAMLLGALAVLSMPLVYPLIFGSVYQNAAIPCSLLVCSKLVVILNGIFGWGLWAAKKDKTMLGIMTLVGASSVVLNSMLIPRYGLLAAASVNLLSEIIILIACMAFMHRIVKENRNHV